jgi:Ca-activated chloride channel family protein
MSFGHPLLLLTLLVVPAALALYYFAERRRMRYAVRFTNLELLASVAEGRQWRRYVAGILFLLALATASVAVARPRANTRVPSERATVIMVIDVSRSMQANDVKPTRLLAAEAAIRTFLAHAPKQLRIGLIAFAGEPQVATPPTTNHELVAESLVNLESFGGFGGTAIGDALAAAVQLGKQTLEQSGSIDSAQTIALQTTTSQAKKSLVSVLFLSDGAQTRGTLLPLEGAQRAKRAGFPVYTVALGTPNGRLGPGSGQNGFGPGGNSFGFPVPPDPETLHMIAKTTGGDFFEARDENTLRKAYARLGSSLGRVPGKTEVTYAFLAGAAGLLLAAGLAAARWAPRLP